MTTAAPEISTDPHSWVAVLEQRPDGQSVVMGEVAPNGRVLRVWADVPADELTAVAFGSHDELGNWSPAAWIDRPAGGSLRVFRRRQIDHSLTTGEDTSDGCALVAETTDAAGGQTYTVLREGHVLTVTHDAARIWR